MGAVLVLLDVVELEVNELEELELCDGPAPDWRYRYVPAAAAAITTAPETPYFRNRLLETP